MEEWNEYGELRENVDPSAPVKTFSPIPSATNTPTQKSAPAPAGPSSMSTSTSTTANPDTTSSSSATTSTAKPSDPTSEAPPASAGVQNPMANAMRQVGLEAAKKAGDAKAKARKDMLAAAKGKETTAEEEKEGEELEGNGKAVGAPKEREEKNAGGLDEELKKLDNSGPTGMPPPTGTTEAADAMEGAVGKADVVGKADEVAVTEEGRREVDEEVGKEKEKEKGEVSEGITEAAASTTSVADGVTKEPPESSKEEIKADDAHVSAMSGATAPEAEKAMLESEREATEEAGSTAGGTDAIANQPVANESVPAEHVPIHPEPPAQKAMQESERAVTDSTAPSTTDSESTPEVSTPSAPHYPSEASTNFPPIATDAKRTTTPPQTPTLSHPASTCFPPTSQPNHSLAAVPTSPPPSAAEAEAAANKAIMKDKSHIVLVGAREAERTPPGGPTPPSESPVAETFCGTVGGGDGAMEAEVEADVVREKGGEGVGGGGDLQREEVGKGEGMGAGVLVEGADGKEMVPTPLREVEASEEAEGRVEGDERTQEQGAGVGGKAGVSVGD